MTELSYTLTPCSQSNLRELTINGHQLLLVALTSRSRLTTALAHTPITSACATFSGIYFFGLEAGLALGHRSAFAPQGRLNISDIHSSVTRVGEQGRSRPSQTQVAPRYCHQL